MSDHKKVLMKFKKNASAEDKAKLIDELKANGAQIHNTDNVNSKIMPFVALSLPEKHYDSIQAECVGGGHSVVEHVEEDGEVHTM